MKINDDGSILFTRNEVFVIGNGIFGLTADVPRTHEIACADLLYSLPKLIGQQGWDAKHNKDAVADIGDDGDLGVFTGL